MLELIYSSVDEHVGSVQFEATMNANINTSALVSWCTCAHISLEENCWPKGLPVFNFLR